MLLSRSSAHPLHSRQSTSEIWISFLRLLQIWCRRNLFPLLASGVGATLLFFSFIISVLDVSWTARLPVNANPFLLPGVSAAIHPQPVAFPCIKLFKVLSFASLLLKADFSWLRQKKNQGKEDYIPYQSVFYWSWRDQGALTLSLQEGINLGSMQRSL